MIPDILNNAALSDDQFLTTDSFGVQRWHKNDILHRENDLPAEILPMGGKKTWYVNGELHRENNKPAKVWRHVQEYYLFGCRHRTTGRAIAASIDHYSLYDYKLTTDERNTIMLEAETENIYLHIAFLAWYLQEPHELINPVEVIADLTILQENLPASWAAKAVNQERSPLSEKALQNFHKFIMYEKIHQII